MKREGLATARWLAGIGLIAFALAAAFAVPSARAQVTVTISYDSDLIPDSLTGRHFRLLFVSSTQTSPTSSTIGDYNSFISTLVSNSGHIAIQGHNSHYRAVASTNAAHARNNTHTRFTLGVISGHPIYWIGGPQVASDYEDFWTKNSWGSLGAYRLESGERPTSEYSGDDLRVWTGTNAGSNTGSAAGTAKSGLGSGNPTYGVLGGSFPGRNYAVDRDSESSSETYRLYGLSPVYEVTAAPDTTPPSVDYLPASVPAFLTVGLSVTITVSDSGPVDDDFDRHAYALSGTLPNGLTLNLATGSVAGVPTTYSPSRTGVNVVVTDADGHTQVVYLTLPAVVRGEQNDLSDFAYSADFVQLEDAPPTVTAPSNVLDSATVVYRTDDDTVCAVDEASGALTLLGAGTCDVTAIALRSDNYEQSYAVFRITVVRSGTVVMVPLDWDLIPSGLGAGDRFRLLFVSSTQSDATSSDIDDYNDFIQELVWDRGHADIQKHASLYRAVASTNAVGAIVNTDTGFIYRKETGFPIYWMGGSEVAANYEEFWRVAQWGRGAPEVDYRLETGLPPTAAYIGDDRRVWTGTYTISGIQPGTGFSNFGQGLGGDTVEYGTLQSAAPRRSPYNQWVTTGFYATDPTNEYRLYGLSPIYEVRGGAGDTTAPTVDYTSASIPNALQVGVAVTITVTDTGTVDDDFARLTYSLQSGTLPAGLDLSLTGGAIVGTPTAPAAAPTTVTVRVYDLASNMQDVRLVLPAVSKGTQSVTGFAYSDAAVQLASAAPTLTAPTVLASATVTYSTNDDAICTVVPENGDLTLKSAGTCVVTATALETAGYNAGSATFTIEIVDTDVPSVVYSAVPATLTVGVEVTITVSDDFPVDADFAGHTYALLSGTWPAGLTLNLADGSVGGAPTAFSSRAATVTVRVSSSATATVDVALTLPAVVKGEQDLSGFAYSATAVELGFAPPTVTKPTVEETATVTYSTNDEAICTVDPENGSLRLESAGSCVVTATAESTTNYNQASATFRITVLGPIAVVEVTSGWALTPPGLSVGDRFRLLFVSSTRRNAASFDIGVYNEFIQELVESNGHAEIRDHASEFRAVASTFEVDARVNTGTDFTSGGGADVQIHWLNGPQLATSYEDFWKTNSWGPSSDAARLETGINNGHSETWTGTNAGSGFGNGAGLKTVANVQGFLLGPLGTFYAAYGSLAYTSEEINVWVRSPTIRRYDNDFRLYGLSPVYEVTSDTVPPSVSYGIQGFEGVGVPVSITISDTDPVDVDFATHTYSLSTAWPAGLTLDVNTGTVTGTPTEVWSEDVTVLVRDAAGNVDTAVLFLRVYKGLQPELTFSYTPARVTVGSPAPTLTPPDVELHDGGVVTYRRVGSSNACTVNADTGALTLEGGWGECKVRAEVAATANYHAEYSSVVTVGVWPELTPPSVAYVDPPSSLTVGVAVTITVTDIDDPDDAFDRNFYVLQSGTLPAGLTLDTEFSISYTGVVSGTPTTASTVEVTVTMRVSDRYTNLQPDGAELVLPPVVRGDQDLSDFRYAESARAGDAALMPTTALTVLDNAELTYRSLTPDECSVDEGTGALSPLALGECTVEATAAQTANYNAASATATVSVSPDLTLPSVEYASTSMPAVLTVGVAVTITVTDTDPRDGDFARHMYSRESGTLPAGLTLNPDDGSVSGAPTAASDAATVTVAVSDSAGNAQTGGAVLTLPATVKGSQADLADFAYTPTKAEVGGQPTLTSPEVYGGATVTYSTGDASICTVNENTGALTLVGLGDCVVTATVAATDDYESATAEFTVEVAADATPPEVVAATFLTEFFEVGTRATLSLEFSEPVYELNAFWLTRSDNVDGATILPQGTTRFDDPARVFLVSFGVGDTEPVTWTVNANSVEDEAYNTGPTEAFTVTSKAVQGLTGFGYTPALAEVGWQPTLTPPAVSGGATVTYSTSDGSVCTVDPNSGALTLAAVGTCVVTATAAPTANYNAARATATVSVVADATPPEVVSARFLPEDFEAGATVTLSLEFSEPVDGLVLSEIALSGNEAATTVALAPAGGELPTKSYLLSFTAGEGPVTVRLAANSVADVANNEGPTAAFTVISHGLSPEETVEASEQALEEFGQAVSAQSAAIVGDRLFSSQALSPPSIEAPSSSLRLRLAGREFDLADMDGRGGLDESDRSWMDLEELTGDSDDWADSAFELSSTRAGGRSYSVWGRGALTRFESGNGKDEGKLDGKVVSGYLGAEFGTPDRLAGVALSRSSGDGDYETVEGATRVRPAKVDLDLTAVHPYARWRLDRKLSVWGSLGLGRGEMSIRDEVKESRADLELQSLAAGLVGEMEPRGDIELAVKGDFSYTRLESKARTTEGVDLSNRYGTKRLRLALAAALVRELPGAATLRPSLELAGRIDDGDSQEGLGAEIGAGVVYAQAGFEADLNFNLLLAHEDEDLESWGVNGGLRYSPSLGSTGLSASLGAGLGRTEADMEGLYENGLERLAAAKEEDEEEEDDDRGEDAVSFRYTMSLGYGLAVRRLGLFRPYASLSASSSSGTVGSGFELKLPGYGDATFGVRGERDLDDDDGSVEFTIGTEF